MASPSITVYLFSGDSLTEGRYGESFVERIAKALYRGHGGLEGEVVNTGRGGDTIRSLANRLDRSLHRYLPDWVVLAIGTNDVWYPWLSARSLGWSLWLRYQELGHGIRATRDLDEFAAVYRHLIDKARQLGAGVLVCTVPPIGEKLGSPLNRRLARLNGIIKHVAAECQVPVADVWQAFVEELAPLTRPSGFIPGEWLFSWMDRRRVRSSSPDAVGRRRRLHLTFDGIHLNSRGADLWADTLLEALAQAQGTAGTLPEGKAKQLGLLCFERGPLTVCCTPGWEARASDLGRSLAPHYVRLASLTGSRPAVHLAVLNRSHWAQMIPASPYPKPVARWRGRSGIVFVPDAYGDPLLHQLHVPETVAIWDSWPEDLVDVGEPARAAVLADLLAVQELARLFLHETEAATHNPQRNDLLAAYLAHVAIHGRRGKDSTKMAVLWDAWGQVLASAGAKEGRIRLLAKALFDSHGDDLVAAIADSSRSLEAQLALSIPTAESQQSPAP
jgi:lysophospholipase L1-like esterase